MIRKIIFLFAALLIPTFSLAATAPIQNFCVTGGTKVVTQGLASTNTVQASYPKCLITVYLTGTTTLATIYADGNNTPLTNPFTAQITGAWLFYATAGVGYDVVMSGGAPIPFPQPVTFTDVIAGGGGGGGGGSPAPPQFAVQYAGPSATAFNADSTFSFTPSTHGVAAYLTNGKYNTDVAQTGGGNNGLANLQAGPCAGGNCTPMFPPTSTSTESATPTVSSTHVQDFRKGAQGDFFYNTAVNAGAGYNPGGQQRAAAMGLIPSWDQWTPSPATGNYQGETQTALNMVTSFKSPGFNYGAWGGPYPGSLWSTQKAIDISQTVYTQGIGEMISGFQNKYAIGDSAGGYLYSFSDGGAIAGADEGTVGLGVQGGQHSTWFHGTANAGNTVGTQLLQATYVAGTYSRPMVSTGSAMLNTSVATISNAHVTGVAVQIPNYAAWSTPIDATVPVSAAWGRANALIPTPLNPITPQSDTVSFTVDGGTNAGGYTAGMACLDGGSFYEQVMVTAVGTISGGVQSVTFTHLQPNPQAWTSLWQGGICGNYYIPAAVTANMGNWRVAYPAFGATTSGSIVGRFFSASTQGAQSKPIPSFYDSNIVNRQLQSLSVSGTTVTASFYLANSATELNGMASVVISGATNSAYNGTGSNVNLINNNQGLTWTQTGVSGTSATAYISLPPAYFAFSLYPGATVTQPATSAGIPLSPNNVTWASGNAVENPLDPSFTGYSLAISRVANSPDSTLQPNVGNINLSSSGNGVSGGFKYLSAANINFPSLYKGGGGILDPQKWFNFVGPGSSLITNQYAPMDGKAYFSLGCFVTAEGGCGGSVNDYKVIDVDNGVGQFTYTPIAQDWFLNNLKTARVRAPILSTGDGKYINGGTSFSNPVAITSNNCFKNTSLGNYGMFGNETCGDVSAVIGAKSFYASLINGGAATPTISSVQTIGTTGSTSYSYVVAGVTASGTTLPGAATTTAIGNATLSSTNNNIIFVVPSFGTQSVNVYRSAAVGGYGAGLICTLANNVGACADTGQTATTAVPVTDTSGVFRLSGSQALTSVQGTVGTKVPAASGTFTTNHLRMTNATGDEVDSGVTGFTGSCAPTTTLTVVNGLITGCS